MHKKIKNIADANKLREWLHNIPYGQYNKVKKRMVEECLVPVATFNNWLHGYCRIPEAGKRDINRVTREVSGVEIFTIVKPGGKPVGVCGSSSGETV